MSEQKEDETGEALGKGEKGGGTAREGISGGGQGQVAKGGQAVNFSGGRDDRTGSTSSDEYDTDMEDTKEMTNDDHEQEVKHSRGKYIVQDRPTTRYRLMH